jgi:hypothetical protein
MVYVLGRQRGFIASDSEWHSSTHVQAERLSPLINAAERRAIEQS